MSGIGVSPSLKSRLGPGARLRGLLVRTPATMLMEMAGHNGFDFIFLDTEHGIADQHDLTEHITAARSVGLPTLVRIGEGESALAARVLDAGAEGIIVPHVQDAAQALSAVRAAHYPPQGRRGFATYTSAGRWGKNGPREHAAQAAARTFVVTMVEDDEGVANAQAIAQTEGVDAIFVGPSDLAAALGYDSTAADRARLQVWAHASRTGMPIMAIVSTAAQARTAWQEGAMMVTLNAQAAIDGCLADWALQS